MGAHFLKVKCKDCNNEQIIFEKASSSVICQVCGGILAESKGGKVKIKAEVVEELE